MENLLLVLTVAGIHLVLVVTPGANFLVALSMAFMIAFGLRILLNRD